MSSRAPWSFWFVLVLLGCVEMEPGDDAGPAFDAGPDVAPLTSTLGPPERPARLVSPSDLDGVTPRPVLFVLHGLGVTGETQAGYFMVEREARRRGWFLVIPTGTIDSSGRPFWNATIACCDFDGTEVDDVGYLSSLLAELEGLTPISDVYFMGHSNGGYMSYRMACERSERVSAIASLAGSDWPGDTDCVPDQAVSVLQIHGDQDAVIDYRGLAVAYPSADDVVRRWAGRAGCDLDGAVAGAPLDLDLSLDGEESTTLTYTSGCAGAEAALWTIVGGEHIPALSRAFTPTVLDWLEAHAR